MLSVSNKIIFTEEGCRPEAAGAFKGAIRDTLLQLLKLMTFTLAGYIERA